MGASMLVRRHMKLHIPRPRLWNAGHDRAWTAEAQVEANISFELLLRSSVTLYCLKESQFSAVSDVALGRDAVL